MDEKKIDYKCSQKDYLTFRYVAPLGPVFFLLVTISICIFVIVKTGGIPVAVPIFCLAVCAPILYFFGPNLWSMRKGYVNSDGIGFEDYFYPWKEIVDLQEPFGSRRIEFTVRDGQGTSKFSFPLPIWGMKFQQPSEFFEDVKAKWTECK